MALYKSKKKKVQQQTAKEEKPSVAVKKSLKSSKTDAKAMGLKSTLVFDNKVVLTSFVDESNTKTKIKTPNIEVVSDLNGNVERKNLKMFVDANITQDDIHIVCKLQRSNSVKFINPASQKSIGRDYIGIKDKVEEMFFGQTFPSSNLHVQIAYNALDIKKIIAPYVDNIIYSFCNLQRKEYKYGDLIGILTSFKSIGEQLDYAEQDDKAKEKLENVKFLLERTSAYNTYFEGMFLADTRKRPMGGFGLRSYFSDDNVKHNFNVLRMLSTLRQMSVHSSFGSQNKYSTDLSIFMIGDHLDKELKEVLNTCFSQGIEYVNEQFVKTSQNNLYILSYIYDDVPIDTLTSEYYDFVVRKQNNNLGINVRKLREHIIKRHWMSVKATQYDSFRKKLYNVINFVISREIKQEILEDMVTELRANIGGEEGKDAIYDKYAKQVWDSLKDRLEFILAFFEEEKERGFTSVIKDINIDSCKISSTNVSYFCKTLYFMCKFLDGKEINELMCAIINKLDGINDLIVTAKNCGARVSFVQECAVLNKCADLSRQLKTALSISKMKSATGKEANVATTDAFIDALEILGHAKIIKYKETGGKTDEYKQLCEDYFEGNNKKLKNFIVNNVLKNKWFFYVARYNSPTSIAKIMKSRNAVALVINGLPDTQVERYFNSIFGPLYMQIGKKREKLIDEISSFSQSKLSDDIRRFTNADKKNKDSSAEKEKAKAVIGLYLTVAYQLTKNIVKVNTRFSIAFRMCERDLSLLLEDTFINANKPDDWLALTKRYVENDKMVYAEYKKEVKKIEEMQLSKDEARPLRRANDKMLANMHFKADWLHKMQNNFETAQKTFGIYGMDDVFTTFRNHVCHLNIINYVPKYIAQAQNLTSYYALYCYVLQKTLLPKLTLEASNQSIISSGQYSKDLMWALNLPFGYNLPRYKNLCNEKLFLGLYGNDESEN